MARCDRDPVPEVRYEPASLPFPKPGERHFSVPSGRSGRAGGDENKSNHGRVQFERSGRERAQAIRESELAMLRDIGVFRSLALNDLTKYRYDGNDSAANRDLEGLSRHGLIRRRTTYPERTVYLTLTRQGHRLITGRQPRDAPRQRFYHGFVKSRDANHDGSLYRLYQQERQRIERMGGRVDRVVLDLELKKSINRRLAKLNSLPMSKQEQERHEIAASHGLRVVDRKIPLPDLRLEYESPDHDMTKVDLELVTQHYRRENLAVKARAGFALFAFAQDAARLRPAMADPEIMQDILSL